MDKSTAVIITGNPKFIKNNQKADKFYNQIKDFLESLGYQVSFDAGEPYTSPHKADLWIGHSRGVDRLSFAPEGTAVLAFGSSHEDSINHPDDDSAKISYPSEIVPNDFHYVFTDKMKEAIRGVAKKMSR